MSDANTAPDGAGQEPTPTEGQAPSSGEHQQPRTYDETYVSQLRSEAAANRKAASEAQAKLKEYEDAQKSEAQKLADRAEAAEKALATERSVRMRTEIAAAVGLDPDLAPRLRGDTEEELRADAEALALKVAGGKKDGKRVTFDSGPRGQAPTGDDAEAWLRNTVKSR